MISDKVKKAVIEAAATLEKDATREEEYATLGGYSSRLILDLHGVEQERAERKAAIEIYRRIPEMIEKEETLQAICDKCTAEGSGKITEALLDKLKNGMSDSAYGLDLGIFESEMRKDMLSTINYVEKTITESNSAIYLKVAIDVKNCRAPQDQLSTLITVLGHKMECVYYSFREQDKESLFRYVVSEVPYFIELFKLASLELSKSQEHIKEKVDGGLYTIVRVFESTLVREMENKEYADAVKIARKNTENAAKIGYTFSLLDPGSHMRGDSGNFFCDDINLEELLFKNMHWFDRSKVTVFDEYIERLAHPDQKTIVERIPHKDRFSVKKYIKILWLESGASEAVREKLMELGDMYKGDAYVEALKKISKPIYRALQTRANRGKGLTDEEAFNFEVIATTTIGLMLQKK